MGPDHTQRTPAPTKAVRHPMASAMAVGGVVSLVWVAVAGVFVWQTLSADVANVLFSML